MMLPASFSLETPAFDTCLTRLMFLQGLAMPFPLRVQMLPQMGRGFEPTLGIADIAVRLANPTNGHVMERALEVYH